MSFSGDIHQFLKTSMSASPGRARHVDREALNLLLGEISRGGPLGKKNQCPLAESLRRSTFRERWGFSVPNRRAVDSIARFCRERRVLDIGCGRGTWSALLALAGCHVESCDSFDDGNFREEDCLVNAVVANGVDFVASRSGEGDVLMLSWPTHWSDMAEDSLRAFRGNRLVYIGEGWGGCTATDEFFNLLDKDWLLVRSVPLRNFHGINDSVRMYRAQM